MRRDHYLDQLAFGIDWGSLKPTLYIRMPRFHSGPLPQIVIDELHRCRLEPACGPKEGEVEKKVWEWDGQEMEELKVSEGVHKLFSKQEIGGYREIFLFATTREALYAKALKAGCVEVVRPAPCPVCGGKAGRVVDPKRGMNKHSVQCLDDCCDVKGPSRRSEAEAMQAWKDMAELVKAGRRERDAAGAFNKAMGALNDALDRHGLGHCGSDMIETVTAYIDRAEAEKKARICRRRCD